MKLLSTSYFQNIYEALKTSLSSLSITFSHLKQCYKRWAYTSMTENNYFAKNTGIVTLQYPNERLPVPERGRYKLHNEIEDCIVCDKCAKICPVDCIEIEPIRSPTEFGKTSNGSSKRIYAAKFNINMAQCCFCGLCTTVCPTECLTMTNEYDFSTSDITEHNVPFSQMTPLEIIEKKAIWEAFQAKKQTSQM